MMTTRLDRSILDMIQPNFAIMIIRYDSNEKLHEMLNIIFENGGILHTVDDQEVLAHWSSQEKKRIEQDIESARSELTALPTQLGHKPIQIQARCFSLDESLGHTSWFKALRTLQALVDTLRMELSTEVA